MSMPSDPDSPRDDQAGFDIARDDPTKPVAANASGSAGGTAVTPPASNWRSLALVGGAVALLLLVLALLF